MDLLRWGAHGWSDELVLGSLVTILAAVCAYAVGICFAICFAAMKLSRSPVLIFIASAFTTVVRGLPELLVVYLMYFGSGMLLMAIAKGVFGYGQYIELPIFAVGVLCLSLSSSAYSTEVIRGAVLSVPKGQIDAARALGMSRLVRFRRILVPQVTRYAIAGLSNVWLFTLKHTSLLSVIGLAEIMRVSYVGSGATQQPFTFYACALLLYLCFATSSNRFFARAERWANKGETHRAL